MTIMLWQLLLGLYGIGFVGILLVVKKRRQLTFIIGSLVIPMVGFVSHTTWTAMAESINQHRAAREQRQAVFSEMAPEWKSLYRKITANKSSPGLSKYGRKEVQRALIEAFSSEYPDQKLSIEEYELFVRQNVHMNRRRVSFNPEPKELEHRNETILASDTRKIIPPSMMISTNAE